ncbi:hypothetical protein IE4872_PD01631 (plasmid) [Rhizobium gallicum]|uniref:Uncharacterized protein n=1 Tax=Rhizobium gallicum TaxID=56730 RepID=A0A1L5NW69_9HYPH|nr:hypothetical protein [Rhizobium gallicum]APO72152.1 hypothetical protein IE4872_PD01631 [Rhizobium gallicum]
MQRKANCSEELMCDDYPLIAGTASIAEKFAEFSSRLALSIFAVRPQSRLPAAGARFGAPAGLTFCIIKSRGGRRIARTRAV